MGASEIPCQFFRLSEAVQQLEQGMWGGIRRPQPVKETKQQNQKLSVAWGRWHEKAGEDLRSAISAGKLILYLRMDNSQFDGRPMDEQGAPDPTVVPPAVFDRLIWPRGIPSDRAYRPTLRAARNDTNLLALLTAGILVLRKAQFDHWYRSERAKGKWPSQATGRRKHTGRPSKQTDANKSAILTLVNEEKWDAQRSIARLRRLLMEAGRENVPSLDTLARTVDELHRETGEPLLRRRRRRRKGNRSVNASVA